MDDLGDSKTYVVEYFSWKFRDTAKPCSRTSMTRKSFCFICMRKRPRICLRQSVGRDGSTLCMLSRCHLVIEQAFAEAAIALDGGSGVLNCGYLLEAVKSRLPCFRD